MGGAMTARHCDPATVEQNFRSLAPTALAKMSNFLNHAITTKLELHAALLLPNLQAHRLIPVVITCITSARRSAALRTRNANRLDPWNSRGTRSVPLADARASSRIIHTPINRGRCRVIDCPATVRRINHPGRPAIRRHVPQLSLSNESGNPHARVWATRTS